MNIQIIPLKPENARDVIEMAAKAFGTDALHQSGLPKNMTPEQDEEYTAWRTRLLLERSSAPNRHYFQAVDTSNGRTVGFTGWHGPLPKGSTEANQGMRYPGTPKWLDKQHYNNLAESFKKARKEAMGDREDYWYLQSMAVHPDYQGRGIASQLMADALEKLIDPDDADCYIEASPAAKRLYEKYDFWTVLEVPQLGGIWIMSAMLRRAKSKLAEALA